MGMSKIVKLAPGKVKAVHQLGSDGSRYAEDVIIDATKAPAGRISYLEAQDGKVGVFSYSFSAYAPEMVTEVKFPEDEE